MKRGETKHMNPGHSNSKQQVDATRQAVIDSIDCVLLVDNVSKGAQFQLQFKSWELARISAFVATQEPTAKMTERATKELLRPPLHVTNVIHQSDQTLCRPCANEKQVCDPAIIEKLPFV